MENSRTQVISNKMPRWLLVILLLIPVFIACFQIRILDNDFYFLYPTGEYIVKNGFPHTDFLSMHTNMEITVQQWLSSVVFYFAYSLFGKYGVITLIYICYAVINYLLYRLALLISHNELLAVLITWLSGFFLFFHFMVSRPHIFTYIVILFEVYLLEKYIQTKKRAFLIGIPILSVLQINLHASMWPMIFVFMAPFIVSAALSFSKKLRRYACGSLLPLLIAMISGIITGFINPYGLTNMLYMTSTAGHEHINLIVEMKSTSAESLYGLIFFALLLAMGIISFAKKEKPFELRYFFLFAGTLFIALKHYKGIPYFLILGIPSFGYMLNDVKLSMSFPFKKTRRNIFLTVAFLAVSLVCIGIQLCDFSKLTNQPKIDRYGQLDNVIGILNQNNEKITLFTDFDDSQYFEFHGYPAFVDGRSELFLKKNNGECDYFEEYYDFVKGKTYYLDFIDKYGFNYFVFNKENSRNVYLPLMHDEDFELIYESENVYLFRKK